MEEDNNKLPDVLWYRPATGHSALDSVVVGARDADLHFDSTAVAEVFVEVDLVVLGNFESPEKIAVVLAIVEDCCCCCYCYLNLYQFGRPSVVVAG